eukprot:5504382-Lingulodinium_polyedra.AAC.1
MQSMKTMNFTNKLMANTVFTILTISQLDETELWYLAIGRRTHGLSDLSQFTQRHLLATFARPWLEE